MVTPDDISHAKACAEYLAGLAKLYIASSGTRHGDDEDVEANLAMVMGILDGKTVRQVDREWNEKLKAASKADRGL